MAALRAAVETELDWLPERYGYAVTEARWPALRLEAGWTTVSIFVARDDDRLSLRVELGGRGSVDFMALDALVRKLGGEAPASIDVRDDDFRAACRVISDLLAGPALRVIAGDLAPLGLRGGENRASAQPLVPSLTQEVRGEDAVGLMTSLEGELGARVGWLAASGYRVESSAWPVLLLTDGVRRIRIAFYGGRHGSEMALSLRLAAADAVGHEDDLSAPELEELVDTDTNLDDYLPADDPDAVRRLGMILDALRPVLTDDDAWRALVRRREERAAQLSLERVVEDALPRADEAFRAGDYRAVVRLLEEADGALPRGAQRKLEIARRRGHEGAQPPGGG